MPELPEVETIRRGLTKNILGKRIGRVKILWPGAIKGNRKKFVETVLNNQIKRIDRIGKLLIFVLRFSNQFLLVHLKMTGQLVYQKKKYLVAGGHQIDQKRLVLPNRHTRLIVFFNDGSQLFFSDLRKFGYCKLVSADEKETVEAGYGLEPLDDRFTLSVFQKILKKRKIKLKSLLLNQKLIAGIGNIYADEICFQAKVRPDRLVATLNQSEIRRIHAAARQILFRAIRYGGTTFQNYLNDKGERGEYYDRLKVYGQQNKPCRRCGQGVIQKTRIAQRGTHYCPKCQV